MAEPIPTPPAKPGYKTSEFWLTIASGVAAFVVPNLPPAWRVGLSVASSGIYAIARGLAKLGL
jgi:hypothetical protein